VTRRAIVLIWLFIGVAVWCGFYELYLSRGAREYLQREAEFELGRGPRASMAEVMARARHDGAIASTIWAVAITGAGWMTIGLGAGIRGQGTELNEDDSASPRA
jgi:hypothetical protein